MASILLKSGRICHSQSKCNDLNNEKLFLSCLFDFWNLHQILNISKKNMMVIPNVFPKLQTVKILVSPLCENSRFGTRFDSQHMKVSQKLPKSPWDNFFHVFSSLWEIFIWKMSPQLFPEILGMLLNTLIVDGKYPVEHWEKWQFPKQMQLSEKLKTFSQFFLPFLESTSNFKHFEKKDDGHS